MMAILQQKPVTPSGRFYLKNKQDLSKKRPERSLTSGHHRKKGRNTYGRITSRRRGGGHKRLYRQVDFRRPRHGDVAEVIALEYDPNRTANIALIQYGDGEKSYIPAPEGLEVGHTLLSSDKSVDFSVGNMMPLKFMPLGTKVHCVEMLPGAGAKICRSAGSSARLISVDGEDAALKMPSGEIRRLLNRTVRATVGVSRKWQPSKVYHWKSWKKPMERPSSPRVRGVAMNPVDHPMGGGEGRTSGGGHPSSPWGQLIKRIPDA